ncbi:MAG TPA: DEAD/DEAH box helicase [Bacteroidales bacterium]|nr:DEAD/DEAH box helicase [Bacteroidales bacterium]
MSTTNDLRARMLAKLKIETLNPMQKEVLASFKSKKDLMLLSPTGTGKTVAYLLPILENLWAEGGAQNETETAVTKVLIVVPSRELAIQIEHVIRNMGSGFKANAVYGGRAGYQDKIDLKHTPTILVGTPGRLADLMKREIISLIGVHTLVLDEFDKSLEIGYENEMKEVLLGLPSGVKKLLTSATSEAEVPSFVRLNEPISIDYLHEKITKLKIKSVVSPTKELGRTLVQLVNHLGEQPGIIFCNFKDSIQEISSGLSRSGIRHGCFTGDMEQIDRERTLIKFRNGTIRLLLATDLAARGLDIPELKFIIHFQLPPREQEFIHRNGRTARMKSDGTAYVLKWEKGDLPSFIGKIPEEKLSNALVAEAPLWSTLYITGGRRDKISKGDIAGLFMKQGKLTKEQLGIIEVKQECSYVGVKTAVVNQVLELVNNEKLKTKKVRVSEI